MVVDVGRALLHAAAVRNTTAQELLVTSWVRVSGIGLPTSREECRCTRDRTGVGCIHDDLGCCCWSATVLTVARSQGTNCLSRFLTLKLNMRKSSVEYSGRVRSVVLYVDPSDSPRSCKCSVCQEGGEASGSWTRSKPTHSLGDANMCTVSRVHCTVGCHVTKLTIPTREFARIAASVPL